MLETRHEAGGLIANRFKPLRAIRHNVIHARDGRRHVAIELVPAGEHDLCEMRRVIATANAIEHPNLCRPREVIEHADQLVIVTELVDGVPIADRLVIGPYDPLHVGALMAELLSVLSKIHAAGLAHGGISATTVMIDAAGLLRLMDLGVVRSPQRPTVRLDLEAVGALAATMLTGYLGTVPPQLLAWIARCSDQGRPFADAAAAAAALIAPDVSTWSTEALHTRSRVPPNTERTESVPAPIVEATPREVARAPVEPPEATALVEPPTPEPIPPRPAVVAPAQPASRFTWLAGGLAVAVAAVAIFAWSSRRDPDAAPRVLAVVPSPLEQPAASRPLPPLPTGAVLAPDSFETVAPRTLPVLSPSTPALEVVFSPEAAWIDTPGVYVLEEAYRQLLKHPLARVEVTGYSSSDGQEARNSQLAVGRALSVKKYLVARGVDPARIAIVAKPNTNDAKSRRAEVRILLP